MDRTADATAGGRRLKFRAMVGRSKPGVLAAQIETRRTGQPQLLRVVVDVQCGGAEREIVETHPKDLGRRPLDSVDNGRGTMVHGRLLSLHVQTLIRVPSRSVGASGKNPQQDLA